MIDFESIVEKYSTDNSVKRIIRDLILTAEKTDISTKNNLFFKNYILTQALCTDELRGISVSKRKFPELIKDYIKMRSEFSEKIFVITTAGNSPSIAEWEAICTECELSFSQKIEENKCVRITKNIFYFTDVKAILILATSDKGLITKNGIDLRNINELLLNFPPITKLSEEEFKNVLDMKLLMDAEAAILKELEDKFKLEMAEYYKKAIIPGKQKALNDCRAKAAELLNQYKMLLDEEKAAEEALFMAKHGDTKHEESITKLWTYLERLKSTGILKKISHCVKEGSDLTFVAEYNPCPIYYCDPTALEKCYKNVSRDANRQAAIKQILDGKAYFMTAPTKIKFILHTGSSCELTHYILEGGSLENPHYRYNSRKGCLGTFATSLTRASSSGDFASYIGLMTQYTQSLTPMDGAGDAGIARLPIVDTEGNIILDESNNVVKIPMMEFWAMKEGV